MCKTQTDCQTKLPAIKMQEVGISHIYSLCYISKMHEDLFKFKDTIKMLIDNFKLW